MINNENLTFKEIMEAKDILLENDIYKLLESYRLNAGMTLAKVLAELDISRQTYLKMKREDSCSIVILSRVIKYLRSKDYKIKCVQFRDMTIRY